MKNNFVRNLFIPILIGWLLVNSAPPCFADMIKVESLGLSEGFQTFKLGTYKLLNVDCGYTDKDIKNRSLSFIDIGACEATQPEWQVTYNETLENAILYTHDDVLYLGNERGVFKISDDSKTWVQSNNGLPKNISITSFRAHNGFLYAGSYEHGIFKTSDKGANWIKVENVPFKNAVKFLYSYQDNLYAASISDELFKTNDGEKNWYRITNDLLADASIYFLQAYNDVLYIGTNDGLFKTTDGGENWAAVIKNHPVHFLYSYKGYSYIIAEEERLFDTRGMGVYKCNDSDNSWIKINKNPRLEDITSLFSDDSYLYAITNDGGIFKTNDAGENWTIVADSDGNNKAISKMALPTQRIQFYQDSAYAMTSRGIVKNNLILGRYQFSSLTKYPADHLFYGANRGILPANDGGNGWSKMNNGFANRTHNSRSGLWIKSLQSHNGSLYASTENGIYRTNDDGNSWQLVDSENQAQVLYSHDGYLYAGTWFGRGIMRSKEGSSWDNFSDGLVSYSSVDDICAFGKHLYSASNGEIYRVKKAKSRWNKVGPSGIEVNVLKAYGDCLYAGSRNKGVLKTHDGVTWVEINSVELKGKEIKELYSWDNFLYVKTKDGIVLKTKDSGNTWLPAENIVKNDHVLNLHLHDGYLYAGTLLHGIFRTKERVKIPQSHNEL